MANTITGMNFSKVDKIAVPGSMETATTILAVLRVHAELPKNEQGVATVTIRQLLTKFSPGLNPLLVEYVCAFGAHGTAVMNRYIQNNVADSEVRAALEADVQSKYLKFKVGI